MPGDSTKDALELYHYPESLCSQMVRIALEEKALPWESHSVMLNDVVLDGENLSEDYLKINPKALVPTLVHHGKAIYDSWAIINYLDAHFPDSGNTLSPLDPEKIKEMQRWVEEASLDESKSFGVSLGLAIPILSAPVIRYCIKQQPRVQFWWKYRKHPLFHRRWGARLVTLMPVPKMLSNKSAKTVALALKNIEQALNHHGEYLLGEFSQADIMMMAHFHRLEDVGLGKLLVDEMLPNIAKYWQALQKRPSYQKAVLDWHEPVWRGALEAVYKGKASRELARVRALATQSK